MSFPRAWDVTFAGYPMLADTGMSPEAMVLTDDRNQRTIMWLTERNRALTDEEREVKRVTDRLLDRSGALSLEMIQQTIDRAFEQGIKIDTITVHPSVRREYLKLIAPDNRFIQ